MVLVCLQLNKGVRRQPFQLTTPEDGPYTHADFARLALAEFPELREEFEEDSELLHLQMHAFTRLMEHAKDTGRLGGL